MLKNIEFDMKNLSDEILLKMDQKVWDEAIKTYQTLYEKFSEMELKVQATLALVSIAALQEKKGEIDKAANIMLNAANKFESIKKMGYALRAYQRALSLFESLNRLDLIDKIQTKIETLGMLDLVIVIDSTGSMGSALDAIKQEIAKMLYILSERIPGVRVGAITYRDHCDEQNSYLIKSWQFVENLATESTDLISFIKSWQPSGGGGNGGEAVADALDYLQKGYEWQNIKKIAILIADEPPHPPKKCPNNLDWVKITNELANDEIKVYTIMCQQDKRTMEDFKKIANITQATFFKLNNIADLPDLITAIALSQLELAEDYILNLEANNQLTDSKKELFNGWI